MRRRRRAVLVDARVLEHLIDMGRLWFERTRSDLSARLDELQAQQVELLAANVGQGISVRRLREMRKLSSSMKRIELQVRNCEDALEDFKDDMRRFSDGALHGTRGPRVRAKRGKS